MSEPLSILIVDDEEKQRMMLEKILDGETYSVKTAADGKDALENLKERDFDIVLTDQRMPEMTGIELLEKIKSKAPGVGVILMTAYGSTSIAAEAMQKGAADYLTKPFEKEELIIVIDKAAEKLNLKKERDRLREELENKYNYSSIIGKTKKMREVFNLIQRVTDKDVPVLIQGESGTGKELVAKTIHYNSSRKSGSFVAINCAAVPDNLLESEFFGYEKGAFTGAEGRKKGKFEQASGGTLFLDEIGAMKYDLQAKILRALQEKEITRIGGTETIDVDIRLVAATSQNLEEAIREGEFRDDLYFRINVVPINLPPLRERREDIPLLIQNFIEEFKEEYEKEIKGITPDAQKLLENYDWKGNVRELRNCLERMIVLCNGKNLSVQDIPKDIIGSYREKEEKKDFQLPSEGIDLDEVEKDLIIQALEQTEGNISRASELIGITYKTFQYRLKKFDIDREDFT